MSSSLLVAFWLCSNPRLLLFPRISHRTLRARIRSLEPVSLDRQRERGCWFDKKSDFEAVIARLQVIEIQEIVVGNEQNLFDRSMTKILFVDEMGSNMV